jgi:enoyl-CoA hydratase
MAYETLILEIEDNVATVKLNRPPVNSLNARCYEELYEMFCELESNDTVAAIIVTGAGDKAFAAGLDVKDVAGHSVPWCLDFMKSPRKALDKISGIGKPTIAAVFGFALGGGCEVATACDLRIATPDAVIGLPEINLGVLPGSGGTQRLPRLIGPAKAKELLFTGDSISGEEAYRIGLVNKVVPGESLMDETRALAKKLAAKPKVAMSLIKSCVNNGLNMDLASGMTMESDSFAIAYGSEDGREGMQAFIEKRKPAYKGK